GGIEPDPGAGRALVGGRALVAMTAVVEVGVGADRAGQAGGLAGGEDGADPGPAVIAEAGGVGDPREAGRADRAAGQVLGSEGGPAEAAGGFAGLAAGSAPAAVQGVAVELAVLGHDRHPTAGAVEALAGPEVADLVLAFALGAGGEDAHVASLGRESQADNPRPVPASQRPQLATGHWPLATLEPLHGRPRSPRPDQALRRLPGAPRRLAGAPAGRGRRLPRAQWRRQVDHDEDPHRLP